MIKTYVVASLCALSLIACNREPATKPAATNPAKLPALIPLTQPLTLPAPLKLDPNKTAEQMITGIENNHPAAYYQLAVNLFAAGKKTDAIFWFYVGQLRYRFHLQVAKNLDPSGDPALFASLSETVGRTLNEYAWGDIPKLAATIDKVLAWDAAHENGFTPKKGNETLLEKIRAGLAGMKDMIVKDQEKIKAQRKANGLD